MRNSYTICFFVLVINWQFAHAAETTAVPSQPSANSAETSQPSPPSPKEHLNGVNGIWLGATVYSQTFSTTVKATIDGTSREIKSKSAAFQNLGITAEYFQMPYNSFGTMYSGTLATSLNHASSNYSMILAMNLQLNLTYAKQSVDKSSYYFYAGLGYEHLAGKDIVNLVEPSGLAAQAGAGILIYNTYNLEAYYQMTTHKVASGYTDQLSAYLIAQGASTVSFSPSQSTSNILAARFTYKY